MITSFSEYKWTDCALMDCDRTSKSCLQRVGKDRNEFKPNMCCNQLLYNLLFDVTDFFVERNISYFVFYGTLLGGVRNQSIIRGTLDVDLVITPDTVRYLTSANGKRLLWRRGYLIFTHMDMARICFATHWNNGILNNLGWWESWKRLLMKKHNLMKLSKYQDYFPYMDLYSENEVIINTTTHQLKKIDRLEFKNGPCFFPINWIYPLSNVTIGDKTFVAPKFQLELVKYLYGKTWQTPLESKHGTTHSCEMPPGKS